MAINNRELKQIVTSRLRLDKEMTSLGRTQVKTPPVVVSDNVRLKQPLAAELAVINSFRCVKRAEYRHGDRNHCLKGNFGRNSILDPRLYQVPCLLVERTRWNGKEHH